MTAFADRTVVTIAVSQSSWPLLSLTCFPFLTFYLCVSVVSSPSGLFYSQIFSFSVFPYFASLLTFSYSPLCPSLPAPCVLYIGRRAGVGLLLRDLGGKWLGSQPSSTGGEPLQCASADSHVDLDQHRLLDSAPLFSTIHFPTCFYFSTVLSESELESESGSAEATNSLVGTKENENCMHWFRVVSGNLNPKSLGLTWNPIWLVDCKREQCCCASWGNEIPPSS